MKFKLISLMILLATSQLSFATTKIGTCCLKVDYSHKDNRKKKIIALWLKSGSCPNASWLPIKNSSQHDCEKFGLKYGDPAVSPAS